MSVGKVVKWGTLGSMLGLIVYFRGDIQRYLKMKMM